MLREWLRLSSDGFNEKTNENNGANKETLESLEDELYESLNTCLSCKSCTHSCPIKVDVPELKSKFLEHYHNKHKRKVSDTLFASFETSAKLGRALPSVANVALQNPITKNILEKGFGIINSPKFSKSLKSQLKQRQASFIEMGNLPTQSENENKNTVILLPDSFNASYDSQIIIACYDVLKALGYNVLVAPILENGKALHVKGFREKFKQTAEKHIAQMELLGKTGLPLISIEVVTRLMHSKEYSEVCDTKPSYQVWSIEAWLNKELENKPDLQKTISQLSTKESTATNANKAISYKLLPHCMEQTADKLSATYWQTIFSANQISLKVDNAGCCGMSGLFGHEKENQQLSETIYQQSWQAKVAGEAVVLASGFSCRCQLENHGKVAKHPIEILSENISNSVK
jgi:Fe-S oxidoreductase